MKKISFTILHVDDDIDDVTIIRDLFHRHASKVTIQHASNGVEAIHALKQMYNSDHLPCLVILDLNMPKMDGRAVLQYIKTDQRFKDIPVIIFSTSSSYIDNEFARKWGAYMITKPASFANMSKLVDDFLDRCHAKVRLAMAD